jgi:hypothetical protein
VPAVSHTNAHPRAPPCPVLMAPQRRRPPPRSPTCAR